MAAVKEFTTEDLRANNGKDRPTAYVAYKGKVYDVSGSKLWKNGSHMRRHQAGNDLTAELSAAPHGPEILERVPELGIIESEESPADENIPEVLLQLFEKWPTLRRHPHPMTVHFPLAFCLAVPLFDLLSLIFDKPAFAHTAFQLLVLAIPPQPWP